MAHDSRPHMIRSSEHLRQTGRDLHAWDCTQCDYTSRGPTTPDACPRCGAAGRDFRRAAPY